jgi:hypothetical protein
MERHNVQNILMGGEFKGESIDLWLVGYNSVMLIKFTTIKKIEIPATGHLHND